MYLMLISTVHYVSGGSAMWILAHFADEHYVSVPGDDYVDVPPTPDLPDIGTC